jgi:phage terminase large subunit GpA-like protein
MAELLDIVTRRALGSLRPPPRLPLSTWIENNMEIPEGVTSQPGKVRLWPYQREIADAITDPETERVTLVKSARLGFTTLLTGALGSYVANEPAPILALLPTEADCRDYVVSDVEPIFEASPALKGLLEADTEEGGRNTLMHRRFPGGSLKVVAAKAPRNLRRHNVRILFIDEADAMEPGAEGSSIVLAEKRTIGFPDRKIVIGSTPLIAETSNVLRSYAGSDQRVFEVPCPDCRAFTFLQWRHIEWPEGEPEKAAFRCPHCEELISERHKPDMIAKGRWRAQRPEVKGHAGFMINALVSPLANAAWGKLAAEFLRAKDDPDQLQPFVNTVLAEGWRDAEDEIDETALQQRVEPIGLDRIPPEVLAITLGVDVQDDRLEVSIVGWSRTEVIVLAHVVIWGSPDDHTTWAELDELTRTTWAHPHGGKLKVDACVVDSGDGDWTDVVYQFCFPRLNRRILAGKGVFGTRPALQASKSKVKGGRLFLVGVDGIKTTLMNRLARGRSIRFSDSLEPVYFEQLTSERKVVRYVRGQPVRRFERKPGARAETLDCLVYAFAARQGVMISLDLREEQLKNVAPTRPERSRTIKSRWLNQ